MPTLEHDLRRYGDLLDEVVARAAERDEPLELITAARPRRGAATALVAVVAVVIVSLIALVAGTRSTHERTPATTPVVAPTTTTTSNPQVAIAQKAAQRAAAAAWIAQHGGRAVTRLDSVLDIAESDRAIYTWSSFASGDTVGTLSRVDRRTLHINSVLVPTGGREHLIVGAGALYVLTDRSDGPGWQLQRLDPDSLEVRWTVPFADTSTTFGDPTIAAGSVTVWASVGHDIVELDAQSGQRLQSVNLTLPPSHTGAFLALDPSGQQILYVAYSGGDGSVQPLQKLDPGTGKLSPLAPTGNETAAGGFTVPHMVATDAGVWVTGQTEQTRGNTAATLYRATDLSVAAHLHVDGFTGRGRGLDLAAAGRRLWQWNAKFVACADAGTGVALGSTAAGTETVDAFAADSTSVAVSIGGMLAIFTPQELCRPEK